jgi:DNA-binding MarR family transcriptional regulator
MCASSSISNMTCTLPLSVVSDPRLKSNHYRVLLALSSFGPGEVQGSSKSVTCSREDISDRTGLFTADVSVAASELAELGLIKKKIICTRSTDRVLGVRGRYSCTYELLF